MVTYIWIRRSFTSSVISIVPGKDIYLIRGEELQPESVGWVNLLLITLCIHVKEDKSWILQIFRLTKLTMFYILAFSNIIQFLLCLNLLIIEWEKHAVKLDTIFSSDFKTSAIKVILQHLFHLIIWMEDIEEKQTETITSTTHKIKWIVTSLNYISKFDSTFLEKSKLFSIVFIVDDLWNQSITVFLEIFLVIISEFEINGLSMKWIE